MRRKFIIYVTLCSMLATVLAANAYAQTATPSPSPSPTTTSPQGAPQTGHGTLGK